MNYYTSAHTVSLNTFRL